MNHPTKALNHPIVKDPIEEALELLDENLLTEAVRQLPQGVFFSEEALPALIHAYQEWFSSLRPGAAPLSEKKVIKRLFQDESPTLSYLIEGKQCQVGFYLPLNLTRQSTAVGKMVKSDSSPLDAGDFLHVRDPIFNSLQNVKVELGSQGFSLKLKRGDQTIAISRELILQFAELARNSRRVIERFPEILTAVRFALPVLASYLGKARPLSNREPKLLPEQFCNKNYKYLSAFGFTFLLGPDNKLLACFEHSGKNLHTLLTKEFEQIKTRLGKAKLASLELSRSKQFLFFIKQGPERFSIEPVVFRRWITGIRKSGALSRELGSPFSLKSALELFARVIKETQEVQFYTLPGHLREKTSPKSRFRHYKDLYFVIESGSVIKEILFRTEDHASRKPYPRPSKNKRLS